MKKHCLTLLLGLILCFSAVCFAGCFSCNDGSGTYTPPKARQETIGGVTYNAYGGHYYLVVEENVTWHEAEIACEQMGGHLAVITSWEEASVIAQLTSKNLWIGATDENEEGRWQWVNGEPWDYECWDSGQPDNYQGNEDYAHTKFISQGNNEAELKWNDMNSSDSVAGYLCEWERKGDIGVPKQIYCKTTISTIEELKSLSGKSGLYFLANDLDLSSESNWSPITNFSGFLDGQNHTIRNLRIDSLNESNLGLFATIQSGVKDLTLENVQISAVGNVGYVGALAGTSRGNVSNVTVKGNINTPYYSFVGGVVGYSNCGMVKDCENQATITAWKNAGGVVGMATVSDTGAVNGNRNKGQISAVENVGGVAGCITCPNVEGSYTYAINDCENTAKVTVSEGRVGGICGLVSGLSESWVEEIQGRWDWATLSYINGSYINHTKQTYFTMDNCKNSGDITGAADYFDVGGLIGHGANVYSITNCENTGDMTGGTCVGGFVGYSPNTYINANNFVNRSRIQGKGKVGGFAGQAGLVGYAINEGEIISTHSYIENEVEGAWVGGVVGYATGIIACENKADIIVNHEGLFVGGVAGYVHQSSLDWIQLCKNSGDVKGEVVVGGIVGGVTCNVSGDNYTYHITNCQNSGNIDAQGGLGGIVGKIDANIKYSLSTLKNTGEINGSMDGYNDVGGIIGLGVCVDEISVCENTGDVRGKINVGGIAGYVPNATIRSTGIPQRADVSAVFRVGGFAGTAKVVEDSINYGRVSASGKDDNGGVVLGGVVGCAQAVYRCENYADITYTGDGRMVGGIVGLLSGSSMNNICVDNKNFGNITATNANSVAGIVGHVEVGGVHTIDNNINNGSISGRYYVGGIVGEVWKGDANEKYTVINCVNNALIEGVEYFGGIIGKQVGLNIEDRYLNTNSTTHGDLIGSQN